MSDGVFRAPGGASHTSADLSFRSLGTRPYLSENLALLGWLTSTSEINASNMSPRPLRPELQRARRQRRRLRDDAEGVFGPFADPAAGVARVDHLLHLEAVQRTDRPTGAFDAGIDLGAQGGGIG